MEPELEADLERALRFVGVARQRVALVGRRRDRLLAVDVHTGVERGTRDLPVRSRGRRHHDRVDRSALEHRSEVAERGHIEVARSLLGPRRVDVADGTRP